MEWAGGDRDTYGGAGGSSRAGFSVFTRQTLRRGRKRGRKQIATVKPKVMLLTR